MNSDALQLSGQAILPRSPAPPLQLWTAKQLCAALSVGKHWVYLRTMKDAPEPLPVVRLGTRIRFDPEKVFLYIRERERHRPGGTLEPSDVSA